MLAFSGGHVLASTRRGLFAIPLGFRLLIAVVALYLGTLIALAFVESVVLRLLLTAFEAGMVGGLCDSIAILMLFKRHAWIPKSGLIARNMEGFSQEVAATIETEMLSPEALHRHLSDGAGKRLREALLAKLGEGELGGKLGPRIAGALADKVGHPMFLAGFFGSLFEPGTPAALFADALDWEELAPKVREVLRERGAALIRPAALAEHIDEEQLESFVAGLIRALVPEGTVARLVKQQLHRLGPDGVADMMERRAGHHLDSIRVNGVVFGSIIGLILGSLRELGVG